MKKLRGANRKKKTKKEKQQENEIISKVSKIDADRKQNVVLKIYIQKQRNCLQK